MWLKTLTPEYVNEFFYVTNTFKYNLLDGTFVYKF